MPHTQQYPDPAVSGTLPLGLSTQSDKRVMLIID